MDETGYQRQNIELDGESVMIVTFEKKMRLLFHDRQRNPTKPQCRDICLSTYTNKQLPYTHMEHTLMICHLLPY